MEVCVHALITYAEDIIDIFFVVFFLTFSLFYLLNLKFLVTVLTFSPPTTLSY
jgi:hypothetical protein